MHQMKKRYIVSNFIVKEEFANAIPIEVGKNENYTWQIRNAIKQYNANYGIIISDTTRKVEKMDDIIYIPIKTFALF